MLTIVCRPVVGTSRLLTLTMARTLLRKTLVDFGEKIRCERLKQNLSQEALADLAGVHRTYIGMIERAEKNITLLNIAKLANALRVPLAYLFPRK